MSSRLTVELTDGRQILCACCYHEAAYTQEALDITEAIIHSYDEVFGRPKADVHSGVRLLESVGGGITGIERNRIKKDRTGLFEGIEFASARTVYDGLIFVTDPGIQSVRTWENARVKIDLEHCLVDFHVHYYTYLEEYFEYMDRVQDAVPWEELPYVDVEPDIFIGLDFSLVPTIRKIVSMYPIGFRIRDGDVIEWM